LKYDRWLLDSDAADRLI